VTGSLDVRLAAPQAWTRGHHLPHQACLLSDGWGVDWLAGCRGLGAGRMHMAQMRMRRGLLRHFVGSPAGLPHHACSSPMPRSAASFLKPPRRLVCCFWKLGRAEQASWADMAEWIGLGRC
jgi:hypothetical protein